MERGYLVVTSAVAMRNFGGSYSVWLETTYVDAVGREFAKANISGVITVPEAHDAGHAYGIAMAWHREFRQLVDLVIDNEVRDPSHDDVDYFRLTLSRAATPRG